MAETASSPGRPAPAGYPAGVAGRLSFRVLDLAPAPATVIAPMCLPARFARAARLACLRDEPRGDLARLPHPSCVHPRGEWSFADPEVDLSDRIDSASLSIIYGSPG